MHFIARDGTNLGALRPAGVALRTDVVHGAKVGLGVGILLGLLAGLYLFGPTDLQPDWLANRVAIVVTMLVGGALGAWIASMIGLSRPNSRHRAFAQAIASGRILLMIDASADQGAAILELVQHRHPEYANSPSAPAIAVYP